MKKKDIIIGHKYVAKVSDKLCVVRIDGEAPYGGWNATNMSTGRQIHIRGALRLRREYVPKQKVSETPAPKDNHLSDWSKIILNSITDDECNSPETCGVCHECQTPTPGHYRTCSSRKE